MSDENQVSEEQLDAQAEQHAKENPIMGPLLELPGYKDGHYQNQCQICSLIFEGAKGSQLCPAHAAHMMRVHIRSLIEKQAVATSEMKAMILELERFGFDKKQTHNWSTIADSLGDPFQEFYAKLCTLEGDEDEARLEWLILQLTDWPRRVDESKTTNISYLMQEAATQLVKYRAMVHNGLRTGANTNAA